MRLMLRMGALPRNKILYTWRLTSRDVVIKTAMMGIPAWCQLRLYRRAGVEIAQQVGLTLIGRMKGKRLSALRAKTG